MPAALVRSRTRRTYLKGFCGIKLDHDVTRGEGGAWTINSKGAYSYTLGEAGASQGARMLLSLLAHRASCSVELTWALRFDEKKKALHPCGIGLVARKETAFKIESVALAGALLSE